MVGKRQEEKELTQAEETKLKGFPDIMVTEVLNGVILNLVSTQPELCRWFILEVFLGEASQETRGVGCRV